jgi:glycosyltransferase involved in cell wall biosynthesis
MFIDITRLVGRRLKGRLPTGIDRVMQAHVEHWALGRHSHTVGLAHPGRQPVPTQALVRIGRLHWVLGPRASQRVFNWLVAPTPSALPRPWLSLLQGLPASWLPWRQVRGRWLVNAGHSGLEHEHWGAPLRSAGAQPLVVVHDLIPITHPQHCRNGEAERHARRMRNALRWSRALVANSAATLAVLREWAARQGLGMPPATAALLAPAMPALASGSAVEPSRPPIDGPYFVCLGTWEPRKNQTLLLAAWERLVERLGRGAAPRLVLIGQRGWDVEHVQRQFERTPALHGVVIEVRRCGDAELAAWLQHARALLFPSLAEGYGMPLVEALAAGVPVIASDLPVFREIAGDLPDYLDPLDTLAWCDTVAAYTSEGSLRRQRQLARLAGFVAPTWDQHFAAVGSLMRRLQTRRKARPAAIQAGAPTPLSGVDARSVGA